VPEKMKAVVKTKPHKGAELLEVDIPTIKPNEVLIKVRATSICGTDVHIYEWDSWSQGRIGEKNLPQILGHEVAGEVVETGSEVHHIKVGDYVSVETHIPDPLDIQSLLNQQHIGERMKIVGVDFDGCYADYFAVPEVVCWKNDPAIPPEIACVQEPLGNATYATLGENNDVAGKSMAIIGDGPIALFSVGVARASGVTNIFLFGMAEKMLEIGKQMGADHVINVLDTSINPLAYVKDHTYGFGVDVSLDMAGNQKAVELALKVVRKGGRLSAFGVAPQNTLEINYNEGIVFKGLQIDGINGRKMFDTWYRVRNFLASGRLDISPVITDVLQLSDFEQGFSNLMSQPRESSKVVLFPDRDEFTEAIKRIK
jgi:threonine 3-dehydrogenase